MTFGSLFSGIGGIDLGLERAGMRCCWQVECDPFCLSVLRKHWPDTAKFAEIQTVGSELERVDLIGGGFPCQDISLAGKGAGIDGERSGLWKEFARLVRELRPAWVLVENVPGLRTRGADRVLSDLETTGYSAWPFVVGAWQIGAPHRRNRVWVVAHRNSDPLRLEPWWVSRENWPGASVTREVSAARQQQCRWPAGPGSPQHEWEQPRVVVYTDRQRREGSGPKAHEGRPGFGDGREGASESSLGGAVDGVSRRLAGRHRRAALRALGNACVPQIVEIIGRTIRNIKENG